MLSVSPEGYCKECNLTYGYCKPHRIFRVSGNLEAAFNITQKYLADQSRKTPVTNDLAGCFLWPKSLEEQF